MVDVERGSGAARQNVRMVLAETFHHSSAPFPPKFKGGVGGKARTARRPTGTEYGKDQGGHVLHVEDRCGWGNGVLLAVR